MNAVIFTRGNNEEMQAAACREFAKANGYTVIAETNKMREAFLKIDNYEALIVYDKTRLSRKATNYENLVEAFEEIDIKVITVK